MNNQILDKSSEFFFEEVLEAFFFDLVCEAEAETYHNEKHIAIKFEDGFAVVEKSIIEDFYDNESKESEEIILKCLKQRISKEEIL